MGIYALPDSGAPIASEADIMDHVGEATFGGADTLVLPVSRLAPDFFKLSTGLAGAILQKCTNYGLKVAIVGDISSFTSQSGALRDFVFESNRRGAVRFVLSRDEIETGEARPHDA